VLEQFPSLSDFLTACDDLCKEIKNFIKQQLQSLKNSFGDYFPFPDASKKWM
jgi:hypothetical protein